MLLFAQVGGGIGGSGVFGAVGCAPLEAEPVAPGFVPVVGGFAIAPCVFAVEVIGGVDAGSRVAPVSEQPAAATAASRERHHAPGSPFTTAPPTPAPPTTQAYLPGQAPR
jgi:hypothetical protein